jgi:FolB domain-containing protein
MDKVFIKDLLVRGIIGVYDWERQQPQDILINLVIDADLQKAGESDNIQDCIDYDALTRQVTLHVENAQRFTVEALANDIAEICLLEPKTRVVTVRVEKPGAVRFAKTVGIEITRQRK